MRQDRMYSALARFFIVVSLLSVGLGGWGRKPGWVLANSSHSTLVVDQTNAPATLDPGQQYDTDSYIVYRNIFDTLLQRNPRTLKIIPWIATSWKQHSAHVWTFSIRKGVTFQDGSPLTAADAAFSLNRILDPALHSPQFANFSVVKNAQAKGNVLTITTSSPSPTLLSYLTTLAIVPAKYVETVGNERFNVHPIGSGPYKLRNWRQGSEVDLDANPHYWKGTSPFAHIIFRAVPNDASRVADLQSGKADLALALTPDDTRIVTSQSGLQVLATPTERVAYIALNALGDTPTKSVQVRRAIGYAINYTAIIKNILGGYGKPVKEVLTPYSFGYDTHIPGFTYDPAKAKKLWDSSGYKNQTMTFITSPAYNQVIVQAIQGDLARVGMKVKISTSDQATYLKKIQSPAHDWGDIRYGRWSCSCLDADGTLYPLFHAGTIWSSYSNRTVDQLLDAARTATNKATRLKAYDEVLTILQKDAPAMGLYQDYAIYGASSHLQWRPDPQESFYVMQMRWT